MKPKVNTFISEAFITNDQRFAFQKCGNTYILYADDNDWNMVKEFRSFIQMQEFIRESRKKDGN